MLPEDLGYNNELENYRKNQKLDSFEVGRIIAEHKERYIIKTTTGEIEAEITGNMRFSAKSREDFPAVGDWVSLLTYDSDFALIHSILPRYSIVKRQAVGKFGETQIIATNIDYAFLVQAVDRDFNINRLERYLNICYSSKVKPIIVLTKTDLISEQEVEDILKSIKQRISNIQILALSNITKSGYKALSGIIEKGKTYCMLGSSGVGKSTLLNNLSGKSVMKTGSISQSTSKGRHVTSHRELIILENGGILIDNPGMREVGITDTTGEITNSFNKIVSLSSSCRYSDCTHTNETGCAVIEAVDKGEIDKSSYENYLKMEREKDHFESTVAEKRKKDKAFGKMVKNFKKDKDKLSNKHN